jgi:16S rRNA (uracil1498-N3)-methyltransferase
LANAPDDGRCELAERDAAHALRVLRLRPGDTLVGLDGRGGSWPLRIRAIERDRPVLERAGDAVTEPRPGAPGSPLPWIEVALSLPRAGRAEDIVDALTQLGAAAISPIVCERTQGAARDVPESRTERWRRAAEEACKQSGRLWLPLLSPPRDIDAWIDANAAADLVVLSPESETAGCRATFSEWIDQRLATTKSWTADSPLRIAIGPEGGFSPAEIERLCTRGAALASLGPHTLRIETAAAAALAIAVERVFRARRA